MLRSIQSAFGLVQAGLAGIVMLTLLPVPVTASNSNNSEARRPNIVFILADDLGSTALSSSGSDLHQTPNIDALAQESQSFTNAYSSHPTCSPSRAAILSGKYPARLGIVGHGGLRAVTGGNGTFLVSEEYTLAEALRDAGYTTCHIGKWHIGKDGASGPKEQGFQYDIASNDFCCPGSFFYPYRDDDAKHAENSAVPDLEDRGPEDHLTECLGDEAAEFISDHKDEPFFLHLSYYAVHTPIEAEEDKVDKYRELVHSELHHRNSEFAGLVEHLDDSVGKVLQAIAENGLDDNTIVVFFSDNGGEVRGVTSNHPLRNGKVSQYLGGVRVPLFIKWPGVTKAGSVCEEPVIGHDLYPTFLQMVGVEAAPHQAEEMDGVDLTGLLKDPSATLERESLCWLRYPFVVHYGDSRKNRALRPCASIVKGDWKLLEFFKTPHGGEHSFELYNIHEDISESHNLAESHPDKLEELKKDLAQWREEVNAPPYEMAYREYEKIE